MYFARNSCIRIPICFKDQAFFKQIVNDLKRKSKDYNNPEIIVTTKYYHVKDGNLLIPRFYNMQKLGHRTVTNLHSGDDIDIKFKSQFRDDKQKFGFEFLTNYDHGVLCMQPGEGKTVVAIASICKIKKKTIVFVHKDSLADQWVERFLEHSDIDKNDIGILNTAKCREILEKPIVISTVQTMCSMVKRVDDIEELLADSHFGMAFWDECHTSVSAEQFSLSSLFLPCQRVYGLSATPSRADGNTDIIEKHVGSVFVPEGSGSTMTPKVVILYFNHRAVGDHYTYIYTDRKRKNSDGSFKMRFDKGRYLQMLFTKTDKTYIPTMQKICHQIYNAGRVTLFLSDRIKILDKCSKAVSRHDVGFFLPRSGDKRDSELLKNFVFSTYGSARDGTDRPEFDCLIMGTNCSNIEQASGRVLREHPNKPQPMIFDIVDTGCEQMENAAEYRKAFYQKKGWEIEERHIKIK